MAGRPTPIFTEEAIKLIFDFTRGTPREINNLCDVALLVGYTKRAGDRRRRSSPRSSRTWWECPDGPHERSRPRTRARHGRARPAERPPEPRRPRAAGDAASRRRADASTDVDGPRTAGLPAACRRPRAVAAPAPGDDPSALLGELQELLLEVRGLARGARRVPVGAPAGADRSRRHLAGALARPVLGRQQPGGGAGVDYLGLPPGPGGGDGAAHRRQRGLRPPRALVARHGRRAHRRRPVAAAGDAAPPARQPDRRRAGRLPLAPAAVGRPVRRWAPPRRAASCKPCSSTTSASRARGSRRG